MPAIDIQKHANPRAVFYTAVAQPVFVTEIARLREITLAGNAFLAKAPAFCQLERTLIAWRLRGKPINKSELQTKFGFPGRMFNAALQSADGQIAGARACAAEALVRCRERIARELTHYEWALTLPESPHRLLGRRRKLTRLIEEEARHEGRIVRPAIFFGRKEYKNQNAPGWKDAYRAARSDHLAANGGADESAGNSTLQVSLGEVEQKGATLWQWFNLKHAKEAIARFRIRAKEAADLSRVVQLNAQRKKPPRWRSGSMPRGKRSVTLVSPE